MSTTPTPTDLVPCDTRRILIADDETPVREIFKMILAHGLPDCILDTAANGVEAVESFQKFHPGVLLMDMKMPLMDGQTAFYKIREACTEKKWAVPAVIFCTGFSPSPGVLSLTTPLGEYSLIRKPVPRDVLLDAIKKHLPIAG